MIAGGGFSFDWALIQPKIAELTHLCTYDSSGTAWSDAFSDRALTPNCSERVEEFHKLLTNAPVDGSYVLVGYSIGGLYARLYASRYPKDVAGMVIVDHAFIEPRGADENGRAGPVAMQHLDTPPVLISETPIVLGIEDDRNFQKLPLSDQRLHEWAMSAHPIRTTGEIAAECFEEVAAATGKSAEPLGNIPLMVIRTKNDSPKYGELQRTLLSLSRDSRQSVAENSTHMILVDQPEVVIRAIEQVVSAVRAHSALSK